MSREEKVSQRDLFDKQMKEFEQFVENMKESLGIPTFPDMKSGALQWYDQRWITTKFIISVEGIKEFFDKLLDDKFVTTKCRSCGELYFPPQKDCPKCRKSDMEWVELSREGTLLTFTQINVKPYSFSHYDDYVVGIVRLPEGINVTAWVRTDDPSKLKIGMKMKLEIVRRDPEKYVTYEWVPIEQ